MATEAAFYYKEFLIVLGVAGLAVPLFLRLGVNAVVAFLVMVIVSRIRAGSVPIRNEFSLLLVVGLAGLLGHARVDFPFQIPSIHLLFLMVAAAFTVVGPVRIFGKR